MSLPVAILFAVLFYLCFGAIRVPRGMDTTPTIPPGSLCIVDKRTSKAEVGHAVFVAVPDGGTLLTRVTRITATDELEVQNDNAGSRMPDSDQFGVLPRSAVHGIVLVVFEPEPDPEAVPEEPRRGR